mgnify:CR=1 FL=1
MNLDSEDSPFIVSNIINMIGMFIDAYDCLYLEVVGDLNSSCNINKNILKIIMI